MWVTSRLRIGNKEAFFGPGTREFLLKIEEFGSIKKAAETMKLSYTKALKMIRAMDEELGFPVVASEKGGKIHGKTTLTEQGKLVLEKYIEIEREVTLLAEKLVEEKFRF